ncbi:MAG: hypothetical protein L6V93_15680 [Clostridiales bacterium]|nr:MAG: hypothetical protein L6V93_15680 [Clostridiales bacterium]
MRYSLFVMPVLCIAAAVLGGVSAYLYASNSKNSAKHRRNSTKRKKTKKEEKRGI